MVQGLAFLSKKSWHTKNKANQEKVWIAEQKKEQETAKANELAREIQQEREAEEFNRIAGKKSIKDRGIDWMYQEGTSTELAKEDAAKKAEEYLLGKEYVGEDGVQGDFHDGNLKEGIHSAINKTDFLVIQRQDSRQQDKFAPNTVQSRNENFRMQVEDPMFFVSQKEREGKNERFKREALYHRVLGSVDDDQIPNNELPSSIVGKRRRQSDKDHKDKKYQRKKMKKSSRSKRDYDERESKSHRRKGRHRRYKRSPSRSRSRCRSRSRSRSHDRHQESGDERESRSHGRKRRYRIYKRSPSRSRSRSRSYDRYEEIGRSKNRRYGSQSYGSYDSRRQSYDDKDTRKNYHRENMREGRKYDGERGYLSKGEINRTSKRFFSNSTRAKGDNTTINSPSNQITRPAKVDGYGLKGALSESLVYQDIGPCKDLIQKKRDEKQNQRNQNLRISRSRNKLTEEERTSALLQMQVDARKRDHRMEKQTSRCNQNDEDEIVSSSKKKEAFFLNEVSTRVNGITSGDHTSLSSRVSQKRHTNQRLHDSFF